MKANQYVIKVNKTKNKVRALLLPVGRALIYNNFFKKVILDKLGYCSAESDIIRADVDPLN